jgi:hypothetical protein
MHYESSPIYLRSNPCQQEMKWQQGDCELQAKPGKRAELKNLLESVAAKYGPGQTGFLGSTRYEVLDNPDTLLEIAD